MIRKSGKTFITSVLRRLRRDRRGVSTIEFAFIMPAFFFLLLGSLEFGFAFYARAVLQGAVEQAARRASLENWAFTDIERDVANQVKSVIPVADANTQIRFDLDSTYYANYADIERPEDFTDANGNGRLDRGECFVDRNGNSSWDTDVGLDGRGSAQDVVVIDAEIQYWRPFPLWTLFGFDDTQTLRTTTILRNQPFTAQASRVGVRICT